MKRWIVHSGLVMIALAMAAPAAPLAAQSEIPNPPSATPAEPRLIATHWQSLYLAGKKIGYVTQSRYDLPDGARRLVTATFLRTRPGADQFGYTKTVTADVDARFRPLALECRVMSDRRAWQVTGRRDDREFVLTRTVGSLSVPAAVPPDAAAADAATVRIPLDDEVTFATWAVPATLMGGPRPGSPPHRPGEPGAARQWLVIDESLGALMPDPVMVHVAGPKTVAEPGRSVAGTAVVCVRGAEQVASLVDASGRVLRSVWQSSALVAEGVGFSEARRLVGAAEGPRGTAIEGLDGDRYQNARLGISLRVPPYPCVFHASPERGLLEVADLTDEARVVLRVASGLRPATGEAVSAAEIERQADLLQREWAARHESVKAGPAVDSNTGEAAAGRVINGTARLGCTELHFRNFVLTSDSLTWFVSVGVADRDLVTQPLLSSALVSSLRITAPEGRVPMQVSGNTIKSPYHGYEISRPGPRWRIPTHLDGPATALELVRDDRAAVAVVRLASLRTGQTLETHVAEQAQSAADKLDAERPIPKEATLAGRKAIQIDYTAPRGLGGEAARCTAVYTMLGTRVFSLTLVAAAGADPSAAKELGEIRESVRFVAPE